MATYYVSRFGSDSNNGLGPDASAGTNKPWLTIGKALGAAGIASGDTVYIGPGVYREVVTVAMTSATVTTSVIGDPANSQGFKGLDGVLIPAGEVLWSAYLTNNWAAPSATALLTLSARDFLAFSNLTFLGGSASPSCVSAASGSTDITFTNCCFRPGVGTVCVVCTVAAGVSANWTFDRCLIVGTASSGNAVSSIEFILTRHSADYDATCLVRNCRFVGGGAGAVYVIATGAGAGLGGGVDLLNSTVVSYYYGMLVNDANISTTFPCTALNNAFLGIGGVGLAAVTAGSLTEDYNVINAASARSNVTAGAHSVTTYAPLIQVGQELIAGATLRPFGMPTQDSSLLGFGGSSPPSVDLLNRARPSGMNVLCAGTASAGAAKTITVPFTLPVNVVAGMTIQITGGTGSGQTKSCASNTTASGASVVTVDGNWKTNPDNTSTFRIYWGDLSSTGTATAGTTTTLTDGNAAWGVNQWTGYILHTDTGTGAGQTLTVVSNTATVLTFAAATAPDNTTTYSLYKLTGITTQDYAVGAFERQDNWQKETTTVRTGSNALSCLGAATHQFQVPVNAAATTITCYMRYDGTYTGTLPSMSVLNGGECGVSDATATMVGAANTWEQVSLSFTPTAQGIVTIQFTSATTVIAQAFADDFGQTPQPDPTQFDYFRRTEPWVGMMQGGGGGGGVFIFGG